LTDKTFEGESVQTLNPEKLVVYEEFKRIEMTVTKFLGRGGQGLVFAVNYIGK
jgi:hypothetical protein